MQPTLRLILFLSIAIVPVAVAVLAILYQRKQAKARSKEPFDELQRRPAGEALRKKIGEYDEKIFDGTMLLLAVPFMTAAMLGFGNSPKEAVIVIALFSAAWSFVFGSRLYRHIGERANYQLGYDGERFVGEELNHLLAHGFDVYHDVQFEKFNLDHVLIGPTGVFCVETKTRRKPITRAGTTQYRVTVDNTTLRWPRGSDDSAIRQAADNARTLSNWLTGAVGDPVHVTPILTIPAWKVEYASDPRRAKVLVMNPKQIREFCVTRENHVDPKHLERIRYQLNQRCKLKCN